MNTGDTINEQSSNQLRNSYGTRWLSGRTADLQSREPGFEFPLCYRFEDWAFSFSPQSMPQFTQLYKLKPGYRW